MGDPMKSAGPKRSLPLLSKACLSAVDILDQREEPPFRETQGLMRPAATLWLSLMTMCDSIATSLRILSLSLKRTPKQRSAVWLAIALISTLTSAAQRGGAGIAA